MATSLPSFSQAFSTHSLSSIPTNNNALPPIQSRTNYRRDDRAPDPDVDNDDPKPSRKRTQRDDDDNNPHIKQEDAPHESPPHQPIPLDDPDPPSAASPLKKRRVTVSGAPHPLNTDLRPQPDQTNSTPISPVVMGFTVNRDNPAAMEQVRSMISVMQKQKALIEQRRGSQAAPSPANPPEERISGASSKTPIPPRSSRRSPNTHTNPPPQRRAPQGSTRPPSPTPMLTPAHPATQHPPPSTQTLPFPPISFARRRAGVLGGKKKPADILISPREAQYSDHLQPAIQSAPPIPHAGQGSFQSARFSMALPRLPPVMGATDNIRRVASNVPPTPTRLSLLRPPATASTPMISVSGRSPPAPNVPIASTLVPPTPASLKHPGYSGDKSAFLAPFEIFYDALNDSKQLKTWLGEQLQKSSALVQSLAQQQEKLNDTIEAAVEKRVSGMRTEMMGLRRRIEELEDALRNTSSGSFSEMAKGKQPLRNGTNPGPHDSYTFPPPSSHAHRQEPVRRAPSPGWMQERERDRDIRGNPHHLAPPLDNVDRHVSPTYDSRRLATVSATRLDPPPPPTASSSSHHSTSRPAVPSPPQPYRDQSSSSSNQNLPPIRERERDPPRGALRGERPSIARTHSHSHAINDGGHSPNQRPPPTPSSASSGPQQQQQALSQQQSAASVVAAATSSSATSASAASSSSSPPSSRRPASPGGESS